MVPPSPLAETRAFLAPLLPASPAPLLEVGCGNGELAEALSAAGFSVTAIDIDPAAVEATRARGVHAELADFRDWGGGPYSVILFTRSLHHIHPLARALSRARVLLRAGGMIAAEEFAHEKCDEATATWYFTRLDAMRERAGAPPHAHDPGPEHPPLERWRALHAHEPPLHTGEELRREIAARFKLVRADTGPYLYRSFANLIVPDRDLAEEILTEERQALGRWEIKPLGLRLVARVGV